MSQQYWNRMSQLFIFGVITHSQGVITYCDYSSSGKEVTLAIADQYKNFIPSDNFIMYWKSSEGYTEKDVNHFLKDIPLPGPIKADDKEYFVFPARVEASVIKESKVVRYYEKSKFPADLDGPLVGSGQVWYDGGARVQNYQTAIRGFNVYVPYDGKIFEVDKFQFLCSHNLHEILHH